MKMQIFLPLILSILFITMIYFGYKSHIYTKEYENRLIQIAKNTDIKSRTQEKINSIKESLSFGLIKNTNKIKLISLQKESDRYNHLSKKYFYLFILSIFLIILLSLMEKKITNIFLTISAITSLIFGLINPVLMIFIHKNIEYIGDITLSFESKGIIQSIIKLYQQNENLIASIILISSIVFPILKSLTLLFIFTLSKRKIDKKILELFKTLTKWSMIDVFVVSTFLVYITSNNNDISKATIGIGLYYFILYIFISVIISLKASRLLNHDL